MLTQRTYFAFTKKRKANTCIRLKHLKMGSIKIRVKLRRNYDDFFGSFDHMRISYTSLQVPKNQPSLSSKRHSNIQCNISQMSKENEETKKNEETFY